MLTKQFFETSRGRIVALLQRGPLTADDIAGQMGLTPSAIRAQLTGMERDGLVQRAGTRTGPTRPSQVFELTPGVEQLLSRAYIPLVVHLLHAVTKQQSTGEVNRLMRDAGKAFASELNTRVDPKATFASRVNQASEILNRELGAVTHVVKGNSGLIIKGTGCPLSAITGKHRPVCLVIESLVQDIVRAPVHECCDRDRRPRCCFEVSATP
jgi:DeoR family transcriptional regulator, suf operon transcriptional repressor